MLTLADWRNIAISPATPSQTAPNIIGAIGWFSRIRLRGEIVLSDLPVVASYRSPALFEILSLKVTRVLALRFYGATPAATDRL